MRHRWEKHGEVAGLRFVSNFILIDPETGLPYESDPEQDLPPGLAPIGDPNDPWELPGAPRLTDPGQKPGPDWVWDPERKEWVLRVDAEKPTPEETDPKKPDPLGDPNKSPGPDWVWDPESGKWVLRVDVEEPTPKEPGEDQGPGVVLPIDPPDDDDDLVRVPPIIVDVEDDFPEDEDQGPGVVLPIDPPDDDDDLVRVPPIIVDVEDDFPEDEDQGPGVVLPIDPPDDDDDLVRVPPIIVDVEDDFPEDEDQGPGVGLPIDPPDIEPPDREFIWDHPEEEQNPPEYSPPTEPLPPEIEYIPRINPPRINLSNEYNYENTLDNWFAARMPINIGGPGLGYSFDPYKGMPWIQPGQGVNPYGMFIFSDNTLDGKPIV